jgi:hypothetical protein
MLGTLGLRVVPHLKDETQQLPGPGDGWFTANPGEAVELNDFAKEEVSRQK